MIMNFTFMPFLTEFTRVDVMMLLSVLISLAIIIRATIIRAKINEFHQFGSGEALVLALTLPFPGINLVAALVFLYVVHKETTVTD